MLLFETDGHVHGPFTWFVSEKYENPHTRELAVAALRVLHRFLQLYNIDLAARALDNLCLSAVECRYLRNTAYLALPSLDRMSDKVLQRVTSKTSSDPRDLPGAVEQNTAAKRLQTIASFLDWYRDNLLHDAIRSPQARLDLKCEYDRVVDRLTNYVSRTPNGHHSIRSLPTPRYLAIIREVFVNPESLFKTASGAPSNTMMRDRAMVLLAIEGLRPGAVGNVAIDDFRFRPGDSHGYVAIKDNTARRGTPVTSGTPTAKGIRSILAHYNSEITVRLWPFTCAAIQEYIDGERSIEIAKVLANRSKSMIFVRDKGAPIGHRTTISSMFARLGRQLNTLGLLDVGRGDPFGNGSTYEFSAYTLRHSAATLYYSENKCLGDVKDRMRIRFGWTPNSTMPDHYANRALSEAASIDMNEFYESLLQARTDKQQSKPRAA